MALINKLRNKMGTVIVVAVGVAIMSFVLADLLGPGSTLFGGQDNTVGEIAGQTIQAQEYQNAIEIMSEKFALRNGRRPSDLESNTIREQAWEKLIADIAFRSEFNDLGIQVTQEEEIDMVQGKNIHPDLVAAFTNPETGTFEKSAIIQFLSNINNMPVQNQAMWYSMEQDIITGRQRVKYDNLLVKSNYATTEEAKRNYQEQTTVAELKYLYVPYYAVSDSLVSTNDNELRDYLKQHAQEYQVEESRALKYAVFPVVPSASDSAEFQAELQSIRTEFETITDDSIYAEANSELMGAFDTYTVDALPLILRDDFENLTPGSVYGPFFDNGYYNLYKISDVVQDTVYAAKARHILFKAEDNSIEAKARAKQQAEDVLRQIQNGEDFAAMARLHGTDGSANVGGNLGWFRTGAMVAPFQDAVFAAEEPGLLPRVVETDFGYHIIDVTNTKTNKAFKIATISRELIASDNTRDEAFRRADFFAGTSTNLQEFESNAANENIPVLEAPRVDKNARRFGTLGNARQVVSWLFRDAKKGSVSNVFELDDNYVVAVMTGVTAKGTAPLEEVRNELSVKVKNQKKARIIIDKLNSLQGTLEEKAESYGEDASVFTTSDLKMSSNSLPNVGFAPEAVGRAFALEPGQSTSPLSTDNGVLILELISITPAPEIADYSLYKQQLMQQWQNRTSLNLANAIKESANIEDRRFKFF